MTDTDGARPAEWLVGCRRVLHEVELERASQVRRYGIQYGENDLRDGTGPGVAWLAPLNFESATVVEQAFRRFYEDYDEEMGEPTWSLLVREELAEAFKENTPERLRAELIQVAALCVSWVQAIDHRESPTTTRSSTT